MIKRRIKDYLKSIYNYILKNKKIFLICYLGDYWRREHKDVLNSGHTLKEFRKRSKELESRYEHIYIYGIEFIGVGETVPRLFMYLSDLGKKDSESLHLILPYFFRYYNGGIYNKETFSLFEDKINFIKPKDIIFWVYMTIFHSRKIDISGFYTYRFRVPGRFLTGCGEPLLEFQNRNLNIGKRKLNEMGIHGKYVCLHAREVLTKTKWFSPNYRDTSINDVDVNTYSKATSYLQKLGYQIIRMGKDEERECSIPDVIDYSRNFYDELMDYYLIAHCKFLIGCSSGLTVITPFWGRPILLTNQVVLSHSQDSLPSTPYDMFIPKKFYSKNEKRLLSLCEMLDISVQCDRYNEFFERARIELYDNTEEEILKATIELNEKMDGDWIESEEEHIAIKRYWEIMDTWKKKHETIFLRGEIYRKDYQMISIPISYSYLKENMYLLDEMP